MSSWGAEREVVVAEEGGHCISILGTFLGTSLVPFKGKIWPAGFEWSGEDMVGL